MSRINSVSLLDPAFGDRLQAFMKALQRQDRRWQVFETVRSPARQTELYAIGRDPAKPGYGKHVTDARAYQSAHQPGLAADIWPSIDGDWEWIDRDDPRWEPLRTLAPKHGLETLSFERPHVQLAGFDWKKLTPGPADTAGWLAWLEKRRETA